MDANGHTSAHPQAHNMSKALLWLSGVGPSQLMMSYVFLKKNKKQINKKNVCSQIHSHVSVYFRAEWRNLSWFMNNKEKWHVFAVLAPARLSTSAAFSGPLWAKKLFPFKLWLQLWFLSGSAESLEPPWTHVGLQQMMDSHKEENQLEFKW